MPESVIKKAKEILKSIEKKTSKDKVEIPAGPVREMRPKQHLVQMPLPLVIDQGAELREKVLSADVNNMTPLEAINYLAELKSMAEKK